MYSVQTLLRACIFFLGFLEIISEESVNHWEED